MNCGDVAFLYAFSSSSILQMRLALSQQGPTNPHGGPGTPVLFLEALNAKQGALTPRL